MATLTLKSFKCFIDKSISLRQYSILVGYNSVGKSSVIQSLLILHDSLEKNKQRVFINGAHGWNMGYSKDIINDQANDSDISISYDNDLVHSQVLLENSFSQDLFLTIKRRKGLSFSSKEMYYLSAERLGPRTSQLLTNLHNAYVGPHGEYTAQVLYENEFEKVSHEKMFPNSKNPFLHAQVNTWLNTIFPDTTVSSICVPDTLTSRIAVSDQRHPSLNLYSTNVGFGISYVLPIILTCLLAKKGSYVLIENPEAHLHPAAQSAMGLFLTKMSSVGLNIIVETHSDYIVTGSQIFVAQNPEFKKDVIINFFKKGESGDIIIKEMTMDERGVLSDWPEGFIDQAARDYNKLASIRGNR